LARGEKVELVGARGAPPWFAWRAGRREGTTAEAPDGVFTLGNQRRALLELLPDPGIDSFVLTAEVRQEHGVANGEVGLYLGHSVAADGQGVSHSFCGLAFSEIMATRGQFQVQLYWYWHPGQQFRETEEDILTLPTLGKSFEPAPTLPRPFRSLRVTLTPTWMQVQWGDDPPKKLSRAGLTQVAKEWLKFVPKPLPQPPQFAPREGLGLYVCRSTASFRNVTIQRWVAGGE
jgi:serine/threonine-protein kinase